MIIGTAGHIDHGKTALVRALTGVDGDRLKEEKARGITIELGFAYLPLAEGPTIGFVDVPGHERFVRTMVAGAAGIDFALLVVAADDGVMPQTREHLAIIDLLDLSRGLAVISKADLAGPGRIEELRVEMAALLVGTSLEGAEILPVSTRSGDGVAELKQRLSQAALDFVAVRDAERANGLRCRWCSIIPSPAAVGDRFVIRDSSAQHTLGGGRFTAADRFASALDLVTLDRFAFSPARWRAFLAGVSAVLAAHHQDHPDQQGMGRERLRLGVQPRLPDHKARISEADEQAWSEFAPLLADGARFRPPRVRDIADETGYAEPEVRRILKMAGSMGWVDQIAHDHFFLRETVKEMVAIDVDSGADDGWFAAGHFRDRLEADGQVVGRKVAIQILDLFRKGIVPRWGARTSNPCEAARPSRVGSTPAPLRHRDVSPAKPTM